MAARYLCAKRNESLFCNNEEFDRYVERKLLACITNFPAPSPDQNYTYKWRIYEDDGDNDGLHVCQGEWRWVYGFSTRQMKSATHSLRNPLAPKDPDGIRAYNDATYHDNS